MACFDRVESDFTLTPFEWRRTLYPTYVREANMPTTLTLTDTHEGVVLVTFYAMVGEYLPIGMWVRFQGRAYKLSRAWLMKDGQRVHVQGKGGLDLKLPLDVWRRVLLHSYPYAALYNGWTTMSATTTWPLTTRSREYY